jgi:endonuclease III
MAAASQLKASDKQGICKKLVILLKKHYKGALPRANRPVLETLLYAACLEDAPAEEAEARFEQLLEEFHDLNEIRVSSISELAPVFNGLSEPDKRAMRIRSTLQFVFEKHFEFDFEPIRRKTLDAAERQLAKIKGLSSFVRLYALQTALGSHVVPLDQSMCNAVVWLGLVEADATPETAAEALKPVLRKSDAPLFCHLLRQLATDPRLQKTFDAAARRAPAEGYDAESSPERLLQLLKNPGPPRNRSAAKKTASSGSQSASGDKQKKGNGKSARKTASRSASKDKSTTGKKSRSSR